MQQIHQLIFPVFAWLKVTPGEWLIVAGLYLIFRALNQISKRLHHLREIYRELALWRVHVDHDPKSELEGWDDYEQGGLPACVAIP